VESAFAFAYVESCSCAGLRECSSGQAFRRNSRYCHSSCRSEQDAGIPNGIYNVVHGFGPGSAGEFLTRHPDVNAITFTGESSTGAAIMKAVAPTVKPVSFELGGKNAAIVFSDCNLKRPSAGYPMPYFLILDKFVCAQSAFTLSAKSSVPLWMG